MSNMTLKFEGLLLSNLIKIKLITMQNQVRERKENGLLKNKQNQCPPDAATVTEGDGVDTVVTGGTRGNGTPPKIQHNITISLNHNISL